jgi:hypothetical protein
MRYSELAITIVAFLYKDAPTILAAGVPQQRQADELCCRLQSGC